MVQTDEDLFSLIDTLLDEEASHERSVSDSDQADFLMSDTRATQLGSKSLAQQLHPADTLAAGRVQPHAMDIGNAASRQSSGNAQTVRFAIPDLETDRSLAQSSPGEVSAWLQPAAASPPNGLQVTCVCLAAAPCCLLLQRSHGLSLDSPLSGVSSQELATALALPLPATATRSRPLEPGDSAKVASGNKKQKQEAGEAAMPALAVPAAVVLVTPAQTCIGRLPASFQGHPHQIACLTKEELRRLHRRQSNRESAQRMRQRSNEAIENSEQQLTVMWQRQQELQRQLAGVQATAARMQAQLQAMVAKYVQEARRSEALRASLDAARASPRHCDSPQSPPLLLPPPALLKLQEGTLPPPAAATFAAFWWGADTPQLLPYPAMEWDQLQGAGGWPDN